MVAAILGKKVGMTRVFDETGAAVPVTVVQAGPCTVLQVKSGEGKDGYDAVQLGYEPVKAHRSSRAMIGHAGKAGAPPVRFVREIRLLEPTDKSAGEEVTVGVFEERGVKFVDVVGTSKGRGFSGVMRRHGFAGQFATHGTERNQGAMSRSLKKGPFVDEKLFGKVMRANESGERQPIRTWARRCTIVPEFVGHSFDVHNGNKFLRVTVLEVISASKFS